MLGYNFEIIYKKGGEMWWQMHFQENKMTTSLLCEIFIPQFDWVEEARIEWKHNQKSRKIIQQLHEYPSLLDKFVWNNDSLWYQECLY